MQHLIYNRMNNIQKLINRELGNYLDYSNNHSYDSAIKRLHCSKKDDFKSFQCNDNYTQSSGEPPVFACKFAPENSGYENLLALANEDGKICIQHTEMETNTFDSPRFVTNAHHNAIFDLAWMYGNMKLVSVSGDHTARLFDVTPSSLIEERIFHGHFRSVKTVACRKDDPAVFATGSRDGAIFVWDSRANQAQNYIQKPDRIISNPHSVNDTPTRSKFRKRLGNNFIHVPGTESVTGLAFQDDVTLISCGAGDGHIKIWDLRYYSHHRNPQPKYTIPYSGTMSHKGFSNLIVDNSGMKLYASCMDNTIYCYNIATYQPEPIMKYIGHQQSTFYVKSCLSPDGNYLVSGSGDNHCYIWNISQERPIVRLEGHGYEVTCVTWCKNRNIKIVTCSDDLRHKIWRIYNRNYELENDIDYKLNSCGIAYDVSYTCDDYEQKNNTTPSESRKRRYLDGLNHTPRSDKRQTLVCERCQMRTPSSDNSTSRINCENCLFIEHRRSRTQNSCKRTAHQAEFNSPPQSEAKRFQNGARSRLFSSKQTTNTHDGSGPLATILEENSPEKCDLSSLTANLPNFVIDGQAPHLKNYSPQKKRDKDWLTKIRIDQSLRNQMDELNNELKSPKLLKLSSPIPKILQNSNGKKCSKKLTMATHSNNLNTNVKSPLLKYFRSTSNINKGMTK